MVTFFLKIVKIDHVLLPWFDGSAVLDRPEKKQNKTKQNKTKTKNKKTKQNKTKQNKNKKTKIKKPFSLVFLVTAASSIKFWCTPFPRNAYTLNVNEWKFHSPIEWNSCKPLKKEWFCTLNSKFPLIKSENHSRKSELPLIWGVKRRTTRKRFVLRLTPQTSGNSLFLESFSLYTSGNLLFNVQNHSFLSGLQEFHSFGEWNFHSFTFREYAMQHHSGN